MLGNFLSSFVGVLVGSAITFFVSRHYHRRSTSELRALRMALLHALEEGGLIRLTRKPDGTLAGGIVKTGEVRITIG